MSLVSRTLNVLMNPVLALLPDRKMGAWPILSKLTDYDTVQAINDQIFAYLRPYIDDHQAEFNPHNPPRDLIDVWLAEMHDKSGDRRSGFGPELGKDTLLLVLQELCFAGMDTTSQSTTWFLFYLLHNPKAKQQIQDEIDKVV